MPRRNRPQGSAWEQAAGALTGAGLAAPSLGPGDSGHRARRRTPTAWPQSTARPTSSRPSRLSPRGNLLAAVTYHGPVLVYSLADPARPARTATVRSLLASALYPDGQPQMARPALTGAASLALRAAAIPQPVRQARKVPRPALPGRGHVREAAGSADRVSSKSVGASHSTGGAGTISDPDCPADGVHGDRSGCLSTLTVDLAPQSPSGAGGGHAGRHRGSPRWHEPARAGQCAHRDGARLE